MPDKIHKMQFFITKMTLSEGILPSSGPVFSGVTGMGWKVLLMGGEGGSVLLLVLGGGMQHILELDRIHLYVNNHPKIRLMKEILSLEVFNH